MQSQSVSKSGQNRPQNGQRGVSERGQKCLTMWDGVSRGYL